MGDPAGIGGELTLRTWLAHPGPCLVTLDDPERLAELAQTLGLDVPVRTVDGRTIGTGARGPVVERLQRLYQEYVAADVAGRGRP